VWRDDASGQDKARENEGTRMLVATFSTKVALTAQPLQTAMDILRACRNPAVANGQGRTERMPKAKAD
jgi:hypothetical protein